MKTLPDCTRCGHSADDHRLDDATNVSPVDPAAKFRCLGDDWKAGCAVACPDFAQPTTDEGSEWDATCPTCGHAHDAHRPGVRMEVAVRACSTAGCRCWFVTAPTTDEGGVAE